MISVDFAIYALVADDDINLIILEVGRTEIAGFEDSARSKVMLDACMSNRVMQLPSPSFEEGATVGPLVAGALEDSQWPREWAPPGATVAAGQVARDGGAAATSLAGPRGRT